MKIVGTCTRGFEEYSAKEAEILGCRVNELRQARIIMEGGPWCIYLLNNFSRSLNKVLLLLYRGVARDLDEIYRAASALSYMFIGKQQSFAVRSERSGVHSFTSIDIQRVVGQAVIDSRIKEDGVRLRVDLENPDVEINADLIEEELFISINTTGHGLNFREYRKYNHPSSLKPTLAASLLIMAGWDGRPLIDAFAGGGTIPIEAALFARSAPVRPSGDFMYKKLSLYDQQEEERAIKSVGPKFAVSKLVGVEISPKHIRGALKNAQAAGVADVVELRLDDSVKFVPESKFDFLVSNPPYGIRSGRKEKVLRLYELFVKNLDNILKEGGTGLIITTEYRKLENILAQRGYKHVKTSVGLHGKLWVGAVLFRA
ncbi:MAG: tRNA (guanine(6)-N2)-methyltransferase [Nitrososphaeria archaeon]